MKHLSVLLILFA